MHARIRSTFRPCSDNLNPGPFEAHVRRIEGIHHERAESYRDVRPAKALSTLWHQVRGAGCREQVRTATV